MRPSERELFNVKRMLEEIHRPIVYTRCETCGDIYREGDWPFCASKANPAGHAEVARPRTV